MKSTTLISLCLAGMLLQGCAEGPGQPDSPGFEDDTAEDDTLQDGESQARPSAAKADVDAKIATVNVPGGQIVFVDEGLTEPGGGIAFWEMGDADLSYLLDDQDATALEVFLAITPEGTEVPERLVEHHAQVARRVPGISAEPRRLAVPLALPQGSSFSNQALTDGGSSSDRDCWAWAGTSTPYASNYGYQNFDYDEFQSNFNSQYSQISGALVSSGMDVVMGHLTQGAGTTAAGHSRAMAFCLSKAIPWESNILANDCSGNQGSVKVFVKRTTDSAYQSWVTADTITLDKFGMGGRFRSNYTNSGGARKYSLELEWPVLSSQGESSSINLHCRDELVVAWRSQWSLGGLSP